MDTEVEPSPTLDADIGCLFRPLALLDEANRYDSQEHAQYYEGLRLNSRYKLGNLLRREPHSLVYSVHPISQRSFAGGLEARIFLVDNVPEKLRKYRLKCVKRLSSRMVLEIGKYGLILIVYKVDGVHDGRIADDGRGNKPEPPDAELGTEIKKSKPTKTFEPAEKTGYQREAARIRQFERRKLNRQKNRQMEATSNQNCIEDAVESSQEENNAEKNFFAGLQLMCRYRPELRKHLPSASRAVLENGLQSQPFKFESDIEMKDYLDLKLLEIVSLYRKSAKILNMKRKITDEYTNLLEEQTLLSKKPTQYWPMQFSLDILYHKLRLIWDAQELLPEIINDANQVYRDVEQRLKLAQELTEKINHIEISNARWDKLNREVKFYEHVTREVVLSGRSYAIAASKLQDATENVKKFYTRGQMTPIPQLQVLKEMHKNLLAIPFRSSDNRHFKMLLDEVFIG